MIGGVGIQEFLNPGECFQMIAISEIATQMILEVRSKIRLGRKLPELPGETLGFLGIKQNKTPDNFFGKPEYLIPLFW